MDFRVLVQSGEWVHARKSTLGKRTKSAALGIGRNSVVVVYLSKLSSTIIINIINQPSERAALKNGLAKKTEMSVAVAVSRENENPAKVP